MKRILPLLALLLLTACANDFKNIKATSCRLVSVEPVGLRAIEVIVEVGVSNPAPQIVLSDISGTATYKGKKCLGVTAEDVVIFAKTSRTYLIHLHGTLDGSFNPFTILTILNQGGSDIDLDISARASLKNGLGKNIEIKTSLDKLLSKL